MFWKLILLNIDVGSGLGIHIDVGIVNFVGINNQPCWYCQWLVLELVHAGAEWLQASVCRQLKQQQLINRSN